MDDVCGIQCAIKATKDRGCMSDAKCSMVPTYTKAEVYVGLSLNDSIQ